MIDRVVTRAFSDRDGGDRGGGEASRDDERGLWRDCGGKVEREGGGKWRERMGV